MKKFKVFLVMCFCTIVGLSLSGCGQDKNQVALYKDLDSSLENYLDYKEGSTFEEEKNNQIKRVEEQINTLKKYQSTDFEDKGIKDVLNAYIKALKTRKEGFEKYYATTDNEKLQEYTIKNGKEKMKESIDELINNHEYKPTEELKTKIDDYFDSDFRYFNLGEKLKVKTTNGDYYLTINNAKNGGFDDLLLSKEEIAKKELREANLFGEVELIDYQDPYNKTNILSLSESVNLIDKNHYTLKFDYGYQYDGYTSANNGFLILENAKKLKVLIPFHHKTAENIFLLRIVNSYETMDSFIKLDN